MYEDFYAFPCIKNKKFHVTKDDKKKENPAKKGKSFIGNFFFVLQCYQMS